MVELTIVTFISSHYFGNETSLPPRTSAGTSPSPDLLLMHCHEGGHDVDGDGEDDGAVVLGGDAVQGLEIPQLEIR